MRIIVPFTARHPDTLAGLPAWAEWLPVGADPHAYWRLFCEVWEAARDTLIVEHDVVCCPDAVFAAGMCAFPWCAWPYHDSEPWPNSLGCTRFSARLMREVPDAVLRIPEPLRDWHNLADALGDNLRAAGWTHHWHGPAVVHHHMDIGRLAGVIGG